MNQTVFYIVMHIIDYAYIRDLNKTLIELSNKIMLRIGNSKNVEYKPTIILVSIYRIKQYETSNNSIIL